MLNRLKLSHHHHTFKPRPHEHTSYLPLGFMLVIVGLVLTSFSTSVLSVSPGPESGSIGLSGTVPGKPPTIAATIQKPGSGQRFTESPVTFSGTCPADTLVELYKNDIFAGSTICTAQGTYSLDIDLLIGQNVIIARVYDALNQPGPDSTSVMVFYDALPQQADPLSSLNFGGDQMLLNTDAVFRGVFPEETLDVPIDIIGGASPYAVNVQWGDSNNKVVPRNDNAPFSVAHIYKKPGTYQVTLQATDAGGRVAFLTVAAIVNGQPGVAGASKTPAATVNQLLLLWPLYTGMFAVVVSFWLGEQREKQILKKHGQLTTSSV